MKRFLTVTTVGVLVAICAAGLTLRTYLRSTRVTEQVTTQLEALYGGTVRVGSVDIGLNGTTIHDFALFEDVAEDDRGEPWLKVASLHTDLSLWDLVHGNSMPNRVTLQGAKLLLRFDKAGTLITNFPAPAADSSATAETKWASFPEADLEQADVTFRKEGQQDLTIKNVNARIVRQAKTLVLSGGADSKELGKLALAGSYDEDSRKATVHLKTSTKVNVTQSILERIPFVPARVWEEIQIGSADTTAKLTLHGDLNHKTFHYGVELATENTRLLVPAFGLAAQRASGTVIVDDNLVHLRNLRAHAFGGNLGAEADLDFRSAIGKLTFSKIKVEGLNVSELPPQWRIPAIFPTHSKLHGAASIEMTIMPERLTPAFASALIATAGTLPPFAMLAPDPRDPIEVISQGRGQLRDPSGKLEPVDFDWQLAPNDPR